MITLKKIVFCLILVTAGCGKTESDTRVLPNAEVWFDGPVDKITGLNWERNGVDWETYECIEEPRTLIVHFKNGFVFKTYSKVTFFDQDKGVLVGMTITPVRELQSFENAASSLNEIVKQLGIRSQPRVQAKLDEILKQPRAHSPFGRIWLEGEVEEGVDVDAEIKPHDKPFWYLSLTFYSSRRYPKP